VPTPTPSDSTPPIAPAGLFRTYEADDFETINIACYPTPSTNFNTTLCESIRDSDSDGVCIRSGCAGLIAVDGFLYIGEYDGDEENYASIVLYSDYDEIDGGISRISELIQKFMLDNAPLSIDPVTPAPRPYNNTGELMLRSYDYINNVSFAVAAGELARQLLATIFNVGMTVGPTSVDFQPSDDAVLAAAIAGNYTNLVMTPARCPDADFAAITWLAGNDINWASFYTQVARWIAGVKTSSAQADPENWPDWCPYWFGEEYCTLFPDPYSYESLRNFSITPSPYRDFTTIATTFNKEFRDPAAPRGCFGVVP
jgi:hypothetical protein